MTDFPDFRALCAQLANSLDSETGYIKPDGTRWSHPTVVRARAALATTPHEPPTDEELVAFLYLIDPGDELSPLAMVRAALERWGHG